MKRLSKTTTIGVLIAATLIISALSVVFGFSSMGEASQYAGPIVAALTAWGFKRAADQRNNGGDNGSDSMPFVPVVLALLLFSSCKAPETITSTTSVQRDSVNTSVREVPRDTLVTIAERSINGSFPVPFSDTLSYQWDTKDMSARFYSQNGRAEIECFCKALEVRIRFYEKVYTSFRSNYSWFDRSVMVRKNASGLSIFLQYSGGIMWALLLLYAVFRALKRFNVIKF